MKINDIVYVSKESRSSVSGAEVKILYIREERGEVKVKCVHTGEIGYVRLNHLIEQVEIKSAANDDNAYDERFKWELGTGVYVELPRGVDLIYVPEVKYMCSIWEADWTDHVSGFITDRWIEEGVVLYNIVFCGTYAVIPERYIKHTDEPIFA